MEEIVEKIKESLQNIAIAKKCGWRGPIVDDSGRSPYYISPGGKQIAIEHIHYAIPNYTGSLNDMYEAEKHLKGEEINRYDSLLKKIVKGIHPHHKKTWHLNSLQKAEAYITSCKL